MSQADKQNIDKSKQPYNADAKRAGVDEAGRAKNSVSERKREEDAEEDEGEAREENIEKRESA